MKGHVGDGAWSCGVQGRGYQFKAKSFQCMSFTYPLRNRFVQERLLEARFAVAGWVLAWCYGEM